MAQHLGRRQAARLPPGRVDRDVRLTTGEGTGVPDSAWARNARSEDLIAAPEVDAVLIASSDATHARYVAAGIAARTPVLCEKLLAPSEAGLVR